MVFRNISVLCLLVLVFNVVASDEWVELGEAKARFSENNLTIHPRSAQSFSKFRFHIAHGDIVLHQAKVYLDKGDVFNVAFQQTIKADGEHAYSRTVPLTTSQQSSISKIQLFYKFKHREAPAQPVIVKLMGVPAPVKSSASRK